MRTSPDDAPDPFPVLVLDARRTMGLDVAELARTADVSAVEVQAAEAGERVPDDVRKALRGALRLGGGAKTKAATPMQARMMREVALRSAASSGVPVLADRDAWLASKGWRKDGGKPPEDGRHPYDPGRALLIATGMVASVATLCVSILVLHQSSSARELGPSGPGGAPQDANSRAVDAVVRGALAHAAVTG